jgi:enamine deaminase RidA (YjgF/YER057c/UK114 family)
VAVISGGTLIVIAGQVALDAGGSLVGPGDFASRPPRWFKNLIAALEQRAPDPSIWSS